MDKEEIEYKPRDREKARSPKQALYWCGKCDRDLVGPGSKCGTCGAKDPNKNQKFNRKATLDPK